MEPPRGKRPRRDLRDAEDRGLPCHPDVVGLEDLGSAREREALDGGDHRLPGLEVPQQRLPVEVGVVGEPLLPLVGAESAGERLQVHARAEVAACAGDDGHPDRGVGVDLDPGVVHPSQHLQAEGVALLGAVQGDHRDRAAALEEQVGLARFVRFVRFVHLHHSFGRDRAQALSTPGWGRWAPVICATLRRHLTGERNRAGRSSVRRCAAVCGGERRCAAACGGVRRRPARARRCGWSPGGFARCPARSDRDEGPWSSATGSGTLQLPDLQSRRWCWEFSCRPGTPRLGAAATRRGRAERAHRGHAVVLTSGRDARLRPPWSRGAAAASEPARDSPTRGTASRPREAVARPRLVEESGSARSAPARGGPADGRPRASG